MINPGAGNGSASDQAMRSEIASYRGGKLGLEVLFERQRSRFPEWGRGKFKRFILNLGGKEDEIALLNVAWCATIENKYPQPLLETCFATHTRRALAALDPKTIIACGELARKFAARAGLRIVAAPHYAARFVIDFDAVRNRIRERVDQGDLR